jgi:hypothetical protein
VTLDAILARTKGADTPLFVAVRHNLSSISKILLENGARIGSDDSGVDQEKNTVLHWAAQNNMSELVKYAIDHGLLHKDDTLKENANGLTPAHLAAKGEYEDTARLLLSLSGAENQQTHDWKALHWAAYIGDVNMVRLLVIHGADVSIKDSQGRTPEQIRKDIVSLKEKESSADFRILDWLQVSIKRTQPEIPTLEIPTLSCAALASVCGETNLYMMDFKTTEGRSFSVEKRSPVSDVVYNRGPEDAMAIAAQRQQTLKGKKDIASLKMSESSLLDSGSQDQEDIDVNQQSIRWIHLPFNNVSTLKQNCCCFKLTISYKESLGQSKSMAARLVKGEAEANTGLNTNDLLPQTSG